MFDKLIIHTNNLNRFCTYCTKRYQKTLQPNWENLKLDQSFFSVEWIRTRYTRIHSASNPGNNII